MKAAVSIPDDVFEAADKLAQRLSTSRSGLYRRALEEFIARHSPDEVTEAMNRVCDEVGSYNETFRKRAAKRVIADSEW